MDIEKEIRKYGIRRLARFCKVSAAGAHQWLRDGIPEDRIPQIERALGLRYRPGAWTKTNGRGR